MRFLVLLDTLVSVAKLLNDMPLDRANRLYLHPIHQDTYKTLVSLIANLRQCRSFEDFHHFQQTLLEEILKIQGHGQAGAWVAKRLRKGRTVPADAPELRSGEDIHDPESWELEADVCERVERQLRSIADALAWRVFNYDRPVIVALSRNELAGPMIGKEGLEAERGFVLDTWRDDGNFVLLHDPTTCLRIGDATEFKRHLGAAATVFRAVGDPAWLVISAGCLCLTMLETSLPEWQRPEASSGIRTAPTTRRLSPADPCRALVAQLAGPVEVDGGPAGNCKESAQVTPSTSPPAGAGLNSITAPGIEANRVPRRSHLW